MTKRHHSLAIAQGLALMGAILAPKVALAESYFDDKTSINFPAPACVVEATDDDPDLPAKRLGCYTNFLVLSDVDGDQDLDILMANGGGYYVRDVAEESSLYINDGSGAFSNATTALLGGVTSRLRQVAIADIDGDGDRDLYLPGGYGADTDHLFIQTAAGAFEDQADARLPPFTWSNAGAAHFGDLDNDGDVDLVVADWGAAPRNSPGNTLMYMNDGTGVFTAADKDYIPPPIAPMVGRTPIDIDLADVDGDFDLDILVNHRNGQSRIFLNDGSAKFTDGTDGNYPEKKGPYTYNVEACDYDEDGDLDLLLDNAGGHDAEVTGLNLTQVLNNDGTGHFTDVTADTITGEPFADDNAVKCADVDGDGHYDLLVASLTNPGEKLLLNDGSGKFAYIDKAFPDVLIPNAYDEEGEPVDAVGDPTLGIDVADVDGDGKLDVVTGQGEAGFFGWRGAHLDRLYFGSGASVADTTPPKFRAIETPSAVAGADIIVHFAVTDSYTSETGEHVHTVMLSYTAGSRAEETLPATFIGGDLFRAVIPAQAAGTELSFTVTATDSTGEGASSEPITFTVAAPPVTGDGGAAGTGATGPVEEAGAPSTSGSAGESSGGTGAVAGTSGSGGSGGTSKPPAGGEGGESEGTPSKDDDDGCDCGVAGGGTSRPYAGIAGLLLGATLLLRRRRVARVVTAD
jgi:MYXO-CTERM domain-containing protein